MELLNKEFINELLTIAQGPCLSLYMPTHRSHPENLQDPIRFKNLVKQLEESLQLKYSSAEVKKYIEPMEALVDDDDLWNHTSNGLAIFSADGLMKVVGLPVSVDELAMVADSFHTKPLRQYLQSTDRYHVLGLSLQEVRLFEGDRHALVEIELSDYTPKLNTDEYGDELTVAGSVAGSSESLIFHNDGGSQKDEEEKDAEHFFRVVSNVIYERYSKPTGWPLILAALPDHHSLFQKVNKNPLLFPQIIAINPTSVSADKLVTLAWEIMEPEYLQKLDSLVSRFEQAKANGKGSDDIKEVAAAAVEGRVDTLLIEADRMIAVRITNLITGNTQKKDLSNPKVDDLLDDMAELVTKMGGEVMVLPADKIPSETGLAAIYRY